MSAQVKKVKCEGCKRLMNQLVPKNRDYRGRSWHYRCIGSEVSKLLGEAIARNKKAKEELEMDYMELDTPTLIQWRRNAAATYTGAIGHGKADRNEAIAERYTQELTKRGTIDEGLWVAARIGIFNGPGSL